MSTREQPVMSEDAFAQLGGGRFAYIRKLSSEEASRMFPSVTNIPVGINVYALFQATGRPITLADTREAALSHAIDEELEVAHVH